MKKTLRISLITILSFVSFFSCKNEKVVDITHIKFLSIQSNPKSKTETIELQMGSEENIKLTVIYDPENVTNKKVTWTSNNPNVVNVNASGLVKALSSGKTIIKVVSEDGGKSAEIVVNVAKRKPKTLTINKPTPITVYIGETPLDLDATFNGFSTNEVAKWTSSNESIATVNVDTGVVTGVAIGNAIIKVESVGDTSFQDTIQIEVKIRPKIEITGRPQTTTLSTGDKLKLGARLSGLFGGLGARWTSSDESIATVGQNTGEILAIKPGSVIITVTSVENSMLSANIEFIVNDAPSIKINKTPLTYVINQQYVLAMGTNMTLNADYKPRTSAARWSSSDENIATINEISGAITTRARGRVTFTAALRDNSSIKNNIEILIYSKSVNSAVVIGVNNHVYQFSNISKTWDEAKKDASDMGGHLLAVSTQDEQDFIEKILDNTILSNTLNNNAVSTVAIDGGGSRYIWIGANDKANEGTWLWDLTTPTPIGQGTGTTWVNDPGGYSNWGRNITTRTQREPDNYQGLQDAAAIALGVWPKDSTGSQSFGQKYQWNDLNPSDRLWYIIETDL